MPDEAVLDTLKFAVGQPVLRTEDPRLLTGGGRFTDDINVAGQAHARFVRARIAHGEIRAIHTASAAAMPGGCRSRWTTSAVGTQPWPVPAPDRSASNSHTHWTPS